MANANETFGKDVEQEAAKEFMGIEGEDSFPRERLAIPDRERDRSRTDGSEAMVGDANPMGVVAKVSKQMGGIAKGAFGIDDPGFLIQRIAKRPPRVGFLKVTEATGQAELSLLAGLDKALKE